MDHPKELTHISLCAGYGGIDLGLRRALGAVRTVAFSEIESFAVENLVAKVEAGLLDPAPIWTDLKTFPWEQFRGRVDILSGGFPCQPFSSAGRRSGDDDPRHLFPYITAGIRSLGHPPIVFFENVEGIISSKLRGDGWADPAGTPVLLHVLRELERLGYEATAGVFSASEIGAPHQRKRVFIMGCRSDLSEAGRGVVDRLLRETRRGSDVEHPHSKQSERADVARLCNLPTRTGQRGTERGQDVENASSKGLERNRNTGASVQGRESRSACARHAWPAPRGAEQYPWEPKRVNLGDTPSKGLEGSAGTCVQRREPRPTSASVGNANSRDKRSRFSPRSLSSETIEKGQTSELSGPSIDRYEQQSELGDTNNKGYVRDHDEQVPRGSGGRKKRMDTTPRQVHHQEGYRGKLNPRWVETLMGLPVGWCMPSCVTPWTIEQTSCDCSGTGSSLRPQSGPSESCGPISGTETRN